MSMTVDDRIAVLAGYKAGKQIQLRSKSEPTLPWHDCGADSGLVNFLLYDYRVAPVKPREWWIYPVEGRSSCAIENGPAAGFVHVREVLEETL